jgi:hypothetical protein
MDLEKYYKKYNFPASSTLIKQLKNEGIAHKIMYIISMSYSILHIMLIKSF